ncbi:MAG: SRPBCC family protein [Planctomycetota bacterium]
MTRAWVLRSSLWLPAPVDEVFPFFADAHNLEAITPPWLRFAVVTPDPIEMRVGAEIDYRLRIRGVKARWRSRIAEWQPPHAFADEQLRGPYRRWYHRHTFAPCDGGTEVHDRVELVPPGGPLAPLVLRLFVRGDVLRIFRHRAKVLAARFGGDPATLQLALERDGAPVVATG